MALPTNQEIDSAVPSNGTPVRSLTNAVLKNITEAINAHKASGDHDARYLQRSGNLDDLNDAEQARDNLGLGSAALADANDFASAAQGETANTAVQPVRKITGVGALEGGGDLSIDRTIDATQATKDSLAKADSALQPTGNLSGLTNQEQARANIGLTGEAEFLSDAFSAIQFALAQINMNSWGVKSLREQIQQEGDVTIWNRGVVSGLAISKGEQRDVEMAEGICFANGLQHYVGTDSLTIPTNYTASSVVLYLYLQDTSWTLSLTQPGEPLPDSGIVLYKVTVPAGNTGDDLTGVTLTNQRRIEKHFPRLLDSPPTVSPVLETLAGSDYRVDFDILDSVGPPCESVIVDSRATNGMTLLLPSTADQVQVRWRVSRLKL